MRNVWIVVASGLLAFANFVKSQETGRTLYSSRYDNLDIDTILSSNRLVNNYVDCLLSRKPCPPEGKDLKRILPEALRTKCSRCSPTQKENGLKIITTLYYQYPDLYQALRTRWDPSGEYHRRFEEYIRGLQFNQIGGNTGPSERPVRNDFDRDQSQILLQTLILSTTTAAPSPSSVSVPEQQRPQLASAQLTQPVAPITSTSSTTTTKTTTVAPTTTTTTTISPPPPTPVETTLSSEASTASAATFSTSSSSSASGGDGESGSEPPTASIPASDSQPTVGPLSNRFGDDDNSGTSVTARTTGVRRTTTPQRPVVVRQTTTPRPVTQRTTSRFQVESIPMVQLVQGQFQVVAQPPPPPPQPSPSQNFQQQPQPQPGSGLQQQQPQPPQLIVPNNVIDHFFIPPGQQQPNQNQPPSPFVGLFSQIGNKLATTADAIAGMLRKTVDVIVTSHIQSHQRALRSFASQ